MVVTRMWNTVGFFILKSQENKIFSSSKINTVSCWKIHALKM